MQPPSGYGPPGYPPGQGRPGYPPQGSQGYQQYPPQYPPQAYPYPPHGYVPQPKQSVLAYIALACAIFAYLVGFIGTLGIGLSVLLLIGAVIMGHISRAEIRRSQGGLVGGGAALAALVFACLGLVGGLVLILLIVALQH